jgi:hypothetical protein
MTGTGASQYHQTAGRLHSDAGLKVQVIDALPGGFSISIDDPENSATTVPDVLEIQAAQAAKLVQAAGLVPKFAGVNQTHSWVFSQSPEGGRVVAGGSTVMLVLRTGPIP